MKAGDKVQCTCNIMVEDKFKTGETYVLSDVSPDGEHGSFKHTGDSLWNLDRFVLIKKKDMQKKFNPKPGDKIICNNGEEFICCTLEFLRETIYEGIKSDKPILGYRKFGYEEEWMDWDEEAHSCPKKEYGIREVIPQSSEVTDDKKEEVKEDPRYSVEEIKSAFSSLGWWGGSLSSLLFELKKINDPKYKEYLLLKAIYE